MSALTTYDTARQALQRAASVDEVKDIRDRAEALRHYARQRSDVDMEAWVAEIKVRADRRIGELSAAISPQSGKRNTSVTFKRKALAEAGLSPMTANRCEQIASIPEEDFEAFLAEKREAKEPVTAKEFYKLALKRPKVDAAKAPAQDGCRVSDLSELVERGVKFGCIYADPPWLYDNQATRASTGNHYDGMTVAELCDLPIKSLAADDAHLHLWTTNAFLFECPKIFDAWGFEFRSTFVWVKPQIGIGNYWRNSHEFLLTAIRGDAKRFNDRNLRSWIECDRGKHSAKPEQVRGFLERASYGPYLELFGRREAPGWAVWGNQIERSLFDKSLREVA